VKAGAVINGYTILEDIKVVGAGLSKWTFAERGGREFFIKEFLSPTYPEDHAAGSEKTKAKKRARCAAFEAHHGGLQRALAPLSAYGGNLIVTLDFFRWGAKYYKGTEKVDAAGLGSADVAMLDLRTRPVLMKTAAPQPEDSPRPAHRARRPQAEQHPDQTHGVGVHDQADRL
jgi:hypothetical protein